MTATDSRPGILAIWNDCAPSREADFEHWFQSEHLAERLAVPGFRRGRRHEAVSGAPKYFVFYLTDSPDVLTSPAYLERVNNPTPLTVEMMSGVFRNMNRTVCHLAARRGEMRGAFAVTARFARPQDADALSDTLAQLVTGDGVACGEIWTAAEAPPSMSAEEKLRGGDRRISDCLMVETLREADARKCAAQMTQVFGDSAEIGIYRLLCQL
ncbi:MAG: hypothetical protein M5U33_11475 [Pseudorhodoplanes sp.]|nr:hypothetical protein [Pseudorhodoplanes sp.]